MACLSEDMTHLSQRERARERERRGGFSANELSNNMVNVLSQSKLPYKEKFIIAWVSFVAVNARSPMHCLSIWKTE